MSASIASTLFAVNNAHATISAQMESNQAEVLVLTPAEYLSILQDKSKNNPALNESLRKMLSGTSLGQYWNQTIYPNTNEAFVIPAGQAANDAFTLAKTIVAIGAVGTTCHAKTHNGKTYFIFKGHAGLRNVLQGTRYLATNPQIIQLGLGIKGAQNVAKGGFILGIVVTTGIEITDFMLNDQKTLYDLVGGIGVEAVKGGLSALIGYAAGAVVGLTGLAVAPLVGMMVVAFAVSYALNKLDDKYQIKNRVINALKNLPDSLAEGMYEIKQESLSQLSTLNNIINKDEATLRRMDRIIKDALKQFMGRR